MKPGKENIAIPPLPPDTTWIGEEPPAGERLTARGPLLVHFFEVGELSSVRTLPFVSGLHDRYREAGLSVLGVHSPRSALAASDEALATALERLEPSFAVANDRRHRIWHAYGCEGWPSSFLWGRGGTLRWVHFGEGAYHETEAEVRRELAGGSGGELPEPLLGAPPSGPGPELESPSDEVFPSGSHDRAWTPASPGEPLIVEYAGAGAFAALDGTGAVEVTLDGDPLHTVELDGPGLYELAGHPEHGMHEVRLDLEGPIRIWSLAFAPGARA